MVTSGVHQGGAASLCSSLPTTPTIRVVLIDPPLQVRTDAANFGALVQMLTGKDSTAYIEDIKRSQKQEERSKSREAPAPSPSSATSNNNEDLLPSFATQATFLHQPPDFQELLIPQAFHEPMIRRTPPSDGVHDKSRCTPQGDLVYPSSGAELRQSQPFLPLFMQDISMNSCSSPSDVFCNPLSPPLHFYAQADMFYALHNTDAILDPAALLPFPSYPI
ncbi:hypothetical protein KP509_14G098600 [Ceratopteris richardii]|uniref:VQ domain-containing protein n=1 Tax=Ceratopteris richardii TaxID=49495 RepID=A0A8T2TAP3_CERRI|nr:hypothetical protein KP509_14G098600 [Ceratopteris richardii]